MYSIHIKFMFLNKQRKTILKWKAIIPIDSDIEIMEKKKDFKPAIITMLHDWGD